MREKISPLFLPCPFCGSDEIRMLPQSYGLSVDCETCGALKRVHSELALQAIGAWNQRPGAPASADDLREALRGLKDNVGTTVVFNVFFDLAMRQEGP